MKEPGCVYLVGAGPGDPGLITARGMFLLNCCGCIIYDHLASEELLAYGKPGCEKLYVGKQKGRHSKKQEEINRILVEKAREHTMVVRLKGGDPYIFGRGGEEALALKEAGIPYEVVPGVTSVSAVLASAGIPLTHRQLSRSFHVFTGHTREGGLPEDFYRIGNCGGTAVILMGANRIKEICEGLMGQGWAENTPAAVIQNGTLPGQRVVRGVLEDMGSKAESAGIGAPAVIAAGEAVRLNLLSPAVRPLDGARVGLIGTPRFICRLKGILESRGAWVREVCRLQVVPNPAPEVEESFARLSEYTWMVFTSANGVKLYLGRLFESSDPNLGRKRDMRSLGKIKIAAIGKGTQEALEEFHIRADYVPEVFNSENLALGLAGQLTGEDRVLIPRARQGSRELAEGLKKAGIRFWDLPVYDVKPARPSWADRGTGCGDGEQEKFDFLVFASSSGAAAFFSGGYPKGGARLCCIGQATARTLEHYGFRADCIPKEASVEGIAEEIAADWRLHGQEKYF